MGFSQTLNEVQGTGSGVQISSGDYNTFYGDSSGYSVTSGSQNTFVGYQSGRSNTTSESVFVGYQSGYSNTTGFDNTFIGHQAGYFNTTGGDNTFFGTESGENNTTGYDNTFVGEESGTNNTTGYENTFIGEDAGYGNTTGYKNVFVGNEAGISANVGYRNVAVGSEAMSDVDDGHHNTSIGDSSAIDVGDGIYNTMVGAASGVATEWADFNTFVGAMSGWDNNRTNSLTNANRNTYVGMLSGASNREGEDNVGMGAFSGYGRAGGVTSNSNFTSWSGNTNRNRTTFIGSQAIAAQNDAIIMGYYSYNEGQYAIGIGNEGNMQNAVGAIGMGYQFQTTDNSDYSIAIGNQVNVAQSYAVGIGNAVDIDNTQAISIGSNTVAQNDGTIVIGYGATSTDPSALDPTYNIAIGYNANVQGFNSIALGNAATAVNDNTMVLGGVTNPLSVGIGTDTPNVNASLDLADTNKGFQVNRMPTANRTTLEGSLSSTDAGLMVFDTDDKILYVWDGSAWSTSTIDIQALSDLEDRVEALEDAADGTGVDKTPEMFNYQTAIKDTNGDALANQSVSFRISILETTSTGSVIYEETHSTTTSQYGLVNFQIGSGSVTSGDFTAIDWAGDLHYVKVEADVTGGSSYTTLGTTQLISVPYALHSKTADRLSGYSGSTLKTSLESKDKRIEALENEVKELKKLVNQLIQAKN